jgi:hypothetical protein
MASVQRLVQHGLARAWLAGALSAMAGFVPGSACTESCLDIACTEMFELLFEPSLTQPGRYEFQLDVDGVRSTCRLDFDPSRRDVGEGDCDGLFVRGSDVPAGYGGVTEGAPFEIVGFELQPAERVSIRASRDAELLIERDLEPRYRQRHFNGSCGTCRVASASLPVP